MPANFLHGVETIEVDSGARPIQTVKTAVVGLVGTAPIFQVDVANQKINDPVLILNDKDAAKYFGTALDDYTIPQALKAIFDQGNGIAIVVNVFDPAVHKTHQATVSETFDAIEDTIQLPHPGIQNLVVKNLALAVTYVADTDYSIDAATGLITRIETGAIAIGETVKVAYDFADPTLVTNSDIIGTVNVSGDRTGAQALKDSLSLFGFNPKILIAPVYCTQDSVTSALDVLAHALRAIAIVDAPIGVTLDEVITGRGPSGNINFNYSSERLVLCYPHLKVFDTDSNQDVLEPFSQRLAGVICAKDNANGYWWSPSNTEILGIDGVERRLTAGINDPDAETNILNENGIVTLFNSFGSGLRTWGNRSAAFPSVTHPKNFINIRRTADVLAESVEFAMLQFLDRPINNALISDITESVNAFIRTLIGRGALIDGKCSYDPAKNPPTEIAAGHLTFDIEFMPPTPAERISFESFINIDLLKAIGASQSAG